MDSEIDMTILLDIVINLFYGHNRKYILVKLEDS